MTDYTRCAHIDGATGVQCETWFKRVDGESFCTFHVGSLNARIAAVNGDVKPAFLEFQNEQRSLCHLMTLDQLDEHVEKLTLILEAERTKLLTARAVRAERIETLDEGERKERRARTLTRHVLQSQNDQSKKEKLNVKVDPIEFMMKKHGLSREMATLLVKG